MKRRKDKEVVNAPQRKKNESSFVEFYRYKFYIS